MEHERTLRGFVCGTAWERDMGEARDNTRVYGSEAELRRERTCVAECGIVEIEMRLVRVIAKGNFP